MPTGTPLGLPDFQIAIIQDGNSAPKLADGVPLPVLRSGTVMVKTAAVALNPSDNKMGATFPTPGATIGMDFSGIIVEIHPGTETDLRIGNRVCGMIHPSNPSDPTNGAFGEYVRARPGLLLRVPRDMSVEQAATLGVGLVTNVLALWDPWALKTHPIQELRGGLPSVIQGLHLLKSGSVSGRKLVATL
ncbi:chaperonin 10-like protein [Xylariaceae sp. FL0662B]|nr:chaperonin 10-like protein [Xylariaceae sp. FL0662B]